MTGNNTDWVTVFSSINLLHANMVKGLLESHDIAARLVDEYTGSLQADFSMVVGGVKVQVPSEAVADAKELLSQIEVHAIEGSGERRWGRAQIMLMGLTAGVIGGAMIFALLKKLF